VRLASLIVWDAKQVWIHNKRKRIDGIDQARAMVERCRAKRDATTDPESRWYYQQCVNGWRAWLKKLERG